MKYFQLQTNFGIFQESSWNVSKEFFILFIKKRKKERNAKLTRLI